MGNADVCAFGRHDHIARLGEVAGYVTMMYGEDDRPLVDAVRVILPPDGTGDSSAPFADLRAGVERA